MTTRPTVALVTSVRHPNLSEDDSPLLPAMAGMGINAIPAVWDADLDWTTFDLIIVRSPWDYHLRAEQFTQWYARVSGAAPVLNSFDVVQVGLHKRYLAELHGQGLPVIPTVIVDDPGKAAAVAEDNGWKEAVVKPSVGLGGRAVTLLSELDVAEALTKANGDWCVQPFLPSVRETGETSVIFLDGEPTHALRKRPGKNDFRVHEGYGGTHEAWPLDEELRDAGRSILEAFGATDQLATRADFIRDENGRLLLVELDVISPCLFLCHHPGFEFAFADAVTRRLRDA